MPHFRGGSCRGLDLNGSNETIAVAGYRLDEAGALGGVAQSIPQPRESAIESPVEIHECVRRPDSLAEILARDQAAWVFDERPKNLQGLILQPNSRAIAAQLTCAQV